MSAAADSPPSLPPLSDDAACNAAIARMGTIGRALAGIEGIKTTAIAAATAAAEAAATPLQAEHATLEAAVALYCSDNRERLTDGGKRKTIAFKAGEASWRKTRDTVEVDESLLERIIATLKQRRLKRMIRVKETLVKTAIANEPDKVKGIRGLKIVPGTEEFSVKPVEADAGLKGAG